MATNTSSSTFNSNSEFSRLHASHCIAWIVVLIVESLLIVILNLLQLTVIVFATHRQLQRRGTCLLIRNLAIADLLAGGISGPLQIERIGEDCDVWEYSMPLKLTFFLKFALLHFFSFASLANLAAFSLERMHATSCPSKHRSLKKWVYKVIIAVIWLVALIREALQIAITFILYNDYPNLELLLNSTLYVPYYLCALVVISIAYISILIKLRLSPLTRSNGTSALERKLTSTLFSVTGVSLLALLPVIIYLSVDTFLLPLRPYFHIRMIAVVFFLSNSLVNPIIYAMKIQGVRAGLAELFSRTPRDVTTANLPLRRY